MRIPIAVIEEARQALESAPDNPVSDVTRSQGIQMLIPQILAVQSKGYSLTAISDMLSSKGLVVSRVALKAGLRSAQTGRVRRPRRKSKQGTAGQAQSEAPPPVTATVGPPEEVDVIPVDPDDGQDAWSLTDP